MAKQGRLSDFYELPPRLASRAGRGASVTFCAFDVVWLDGELLTDRSYVKSRKLLG